MAKLLISAVDTSSPTASEFHPKVVPVENQRINEIISFQTLCLGNRGKSRPAVFYMLTENFSSSKKGKNFGVGEGVTTKFLVLVSRKILGNKQRKIYPQHLWFAESIKFLVFTFGNNAKIIFGSYGESN